MTAAVRGERGFVLSMVIFAVAALSIAGTALFLVVQSENAMANAGAESSAALHLANAGLARYMGEHFGTPDDTVVYEMGGGEVTVTASLVVPLGDTADIYVVESEALIRDRRVSGLFSRRAVQQFARLRRRPFNPVAALALATASVQTHSNVVLDGNDACGVSIQVADLATLGARDRDLNSIDRHDAYASRDSLLAAMGVDWDLLTDPTTPFDFESWSGYSAAAADSSTTIRLTGDQRVNFLRSGRGLLVIDGKLTIDNLVLPWQWEGIILAESIEIRNNAAASIQGSLLSGFDGTQLGIGSNGLKNIQIRYNSCLVSAASRDMATFEPVPNTWWESPG